MGIALWVTEKERTKVRFCSLALENRGKAPLKDVWVQISLPHGRSSEASELPLKSSEMPMGTERRIMEVRDRTLIEYRIEKMRPRDFIGLLEFLVYERSELRHYKNGIVQDRDDSTAADGKLAIDEVRAYLRSENHKEITAKSWIVAATSESIDKLEELSGHVAENLYYIDRPWLLIRAKPGFPVWLPRPHRIWTRRMNLYQFPFRKKAGNTAFDLPNESQGIFQTADVLPIIPE